jgi:predicted SPOUT superfamily RNA methylase MTH1
MHRHWPAALIGVAALLACTATAGAAGGYGPSTPPSSTIAPTGFQSNVQTVTMVGVSGGQLSAPAPHGARVTVKIPAHAFTGPVQVAITRPSLSGLSELLGPLGYPGYQVTTGFSVVVSHRNGKVITGTFGKPVTVTIRGSKIGAKGEKVLALASSKSAVALSSALTSGRVVFSIRKGSSLIVVSRSAGT